MGDLEPGMFDRIVALEKGFERIWKHVLGEDYYIVDPIDGISAIEHFTSKVIECYDRKNKYGDIFIKKILPITAILGVCSLPTFIFIIYCLMDLIGIF